MDSRQRRKCLRNEPPSMKQLHIIINSYLGEAPTKVAFDEWLRTLSSSKFEQLWQLCTLFPSHPYVSINSKMKIEMERRLQEVVEKNIL